MLPLFFPQTYCKGWEQIGRSDLTVMVVLKWDSDSWFPSGFFKIPIYFYFISVGTKESGYATWAYHRGTVGSTNFQTFGFVQVGYYCTFFKIFGWIWFLSILKDIHYIQWIFRGYHYTLTHYFSKEKRGKNIYDKECEFFLRISFKIFFKKKKKSVGITF